MVTELKNESPIIDDKDKIIQRLIFFKLQIENSGSITGYITAGETTFFLSDFRDFFYRLKGT